MTPRAPARWPLVLAVALSVAALATLVWLRGRLVAEERTQLDNAVRVFERTDALGAPEDDSVRINAIESLAMGLEESALIERVFVAKSLRRGSAGGREVLLRPFAHELLHPDWRVEVDGWLRLPIGDHADPAGWLYVQVRPTNRRAVDRAIGGFVVLLVVCLGVLVTRQQGKEMELSRTLSELERRKAEIIRMERLALAGQLSANIFHDIRKPVLNIKHEADDLLESAPTPEQYAAAVRSIREQTALFLAILRELGLENFVRAEGGEGEFCSLEEAARRALALVRYERGNIEVAIDIPPDVPPVFAPPHRLIQLVSNLLLNAFQALGGNGNVRVAARASAGTIELIVEDDGPGIPADLRARLFRPFVTTKPEGMGSGLGLYICSTIAEELGGAIRLEAEDDRKGARFVVELRARSNA